jgi:hypothetical protein
VIWVILRSNPNPNFEDIKKKPQSLVEYQKIKVIWVILRSDPNPNLEDIKKKL